jgi:acyl carrier protein
MLGLSDAIENDGQLMDSGLNSMMAVQLRAVLSKEVSMKLPATLLFDYPTISALTTFINSGIENEATASPSAPPTRSVPARVLLPASEAVLRCQGLACRYPSTFSSLQAMNCNMRLGSFGITQVPLARWDIASSGASGPTYPHGAFIDCV